RLRNEEHSRLEEMRLKHAENVAKDSRRRAAALRLTTRQAELDREDLERRAKEEANSEGQEAIRSEKERLTTERDKKIDLAIRRLQRERLEFEETSKAEAEREARRLEESHVEGKRVLAEKQEQWEVRHADCTDALQSLVESR
ncbi:unnamed protein product, partial [Laminaria digitata]